MIAIIIGDGQILFDGIYYQENDFHVNIYREQLKPLESLVNDGVHTKIAVRLNKGEKLKVCSYISDDELKDIIYNDINNIIIPRYNFDDTRQSTPQSFSYTDVHINGDTISRLYDNVTITFTDRI